MYQCDMSYLESVTVTQVKDNHKINISVVVRVMFSVSKPQVCPGCFAQLPCKMPNQRRQPVQVDRTLQSFQLKCSLHTTKHTPKNNNN